MSDSLITPAMLARGRQDASVGLSMHYDHVSQQGLLETVGNGAVSRFLALPRTMSTGAASDGPPVPDGDIQ